MSEAITADIPLTPPVAAKLSAPRPEVAKPDPEAAPQVPEPPGALTKLFARFGFTLTRKQAIVAASAVASLVAGVAGVWAVAGARQKPPSQPLANELPPVTKSQAERPPSTKAEPVAAEAKTAQPAGGSVLPAGAFGIPTAPDPDPKPKSPPATTFTPPIPLSPPSIDVTPTPPAAGEGGPVAPGILPGDVTRPSPPSGLGGTPPTSPTGVVPPTMPSVEMQRESRTPPLPVVPSFGPGATDTPPPGALPPPGQVQPAGGTFLPSGFSGTRTQIPEGPPKTGEPGGATPPGKTNSGLPPLPGDVPPPGVGGGAKLPTLPGDPPPATGGGVSPKLPIPGDNPPGGAGAGGATKLPALPGDRPPPVLGGSPPGGTAPTAPDISPGGGNPGGGLPPPGALAPPGGLAPPVGVTPPAGGNGAVNLGPAVPTSPSGVALPPVGGGEQPPPVAGTPPKSADPPPFPGHSIAPPLGGATPPAAPALPGGGMRIEAVKPPGGDVEVRPAASSVVPERAAKTSYDVDIYEPKATDTYESISTAFYNDSKYAAALRQYNRNAPLGGQRIDVPPVHVLKRQAAGTTTGVAPARPAVTEWSAPATPPPARRSNVYVVPAGGATLRTIARQTLGSDQEWQRIWDLNRSHSDPSRALPAGTEITLPSDARNPQ